MSTSFQSRWNSIKVYLLKHADDLEYNAGMGGHHHDGGAQAIRDRIKVFEMGLAQTIPSEWERIVAPLMDPEWADYQRLRAKFERR